MTLQNPDPREALAGMRAVKAVITADGPMVDTQRSTMEMAQRYFLRTSYDIDALEPIEPSDLAREIVDPALRRQLVQVMCAYVMVGKEIRPDHVASIRRYARALDIDEPSVDHLRYIIEDRIRWLQFDFRRRAAVGDAIKQAYHEDGIKGAFSTIMQIAGHGEEAEVARASTPSRSCLPGRSAMSSGGSTAITSSLSPATRTALRSRSSRTISCISSRATTPISWARSGRSRSRPASSARSRSCSCSYSCSKPRSGSIWWPSSRGQGRSKGFFDQPGVLEEVFKAYSRGAAMSVDLMDGHWDYWAVIDRPVAEIRERYGVPA